MEFISSFFSLILFVPWLLIVLIPLMTLIGGGTYCMLTADGYKLTSKDNILEFPNQEKELAEFSRIDNYLSA